MKDIARRLIRSGLLISVALTPLFSLREFLRFSGFLNLPASILFFSLVKDLLLTGIFFLCLVTIVRNKAYPKRVLPFFLFFFAYTVLVAALSMPDVLTIVAGMRWAMPLLFIFLLCPFVDRPYLHQLAKVCMYLLCATTAVQLYQVANRQFHWGTSLYTEWLGRVPGFYELPSTAGVLTCLFFFIIRYYYTGSQLVRRSMLVLAILSNFLLSISTTGFLLMLIMLSFPLLYRPGRFRPVYIATAFIGTVITYFFLDQLNGRFPGDSSFSWNIRVALMEDEWYRSQWISSRFGGATNAVTVLKSALHQPINPAIVSGGGEAFYPPLLGNYGKFFFLISIGLLLYLFFKLVKHRTEAKSLFFFIVILAALTVRITEIFPLGILISILSAYYIGNYKPVPTLSKLTSPNDLPSSGLQKNR